MTISRRTRKNILDWLAVEKVGWSGRLTEEQFLDRVADLDALGSTDPRFGNARSDIRQHRVNNDDWDNDWVYSYEPLSLLTAPDDAFATFLTEMLHPVVRPVSDNARALARELNDFLRADRVELAETSMIGDRPVWSSRLIATDGVPNRAIPADHRPVGEPSRIWEPGRLRLFLSHVAAHKVQVSRLKGELAIYGVSAFVAHEDIEPTLEWQGEIEYALSTMHALVALLTTDFHSSNWTDQEVGIAFGRGALVISVRVPENPYGFFAKHQALRGDLAEAPKLAAAIVDLLLRRRETAAEMREGLTSGIENSPSWVASKAISLKIAATNGFSSSQLDRIEATIASNSQVADSFGVPARLRRYIVTSRGT